MDQLTEYRHRKQKEYEKKIRQEELKDKYKNQIILNKKQLSAIRIQRFMKKHYFHQPINQLDDEIKKVDGLLRYRIQLTELNTFDFFDEADDDMVIGLMQTLSLDETNSMKSIWLIINLEHYGQNPDGPIYVNDKVYYLSRQQKEKVKEKWNLLNPETRKGMIYRQNMAYQKSLAKDMKFAL